MANEMSKSQKAWETTKKVFRVLKLIVHFLWIIVAVACILVPLFFPMMYPKLFGEPWGVGAVYSNETALMVAGIFHLTAAFAMLVGAYNVSCLTLLSSVAYIIGSMFLFNSWILDLINILSLFLGLSFRFLPCIIIERHPRLFKWFSAFKWVFFTILIVAYYWFAIEFPYEASGIVKLLFIGGSIMGTLFAFTLFRDIEIISEFSELEKTLNQLRDTQADLYCATPDGGTYYVGDLDEYRDEAHDRWSSFKDMDSER